MITLQWIASIWCQNYQKCWGTSQNIQNNAKLQKQSNNDQSVSIWRENDQKCWVTSQNIQNNTKLRKGSNCNELHRFDVKTITTTQNYESDQIIMHCINLTSKRSKKLSYVAKLQMWSYYDEFASIWRQNDNNNSKLRKWSNYNALHQFDVKTITTTQNYENDQIIMNLHRFDVKTITTQNYESDQIIMNCIDLTSKQSKMLRYVAKHSKQRKTTKEIKLQWISSIWRQNDHNNAKLRKWSNYNALHQFDVKTI